MRIVELRSGGGPPAAPVVLGFGAVEIGNGTMDKLAEYLAGEVAG